MNKAPRQPVRALLALTRGAGLALCFWLAGSMASFACEVAQSQLKDVVTSSVVRNDHANAWYANLSKRYDHGVLGDAKEPTVLGMELPADLFCGETITLERPYVFEDIAPRLVDLTGDSQPEVITVRSHEKFGAQLAIYGMVRGKLKLIAETPHIGQRNRWLAPIGAADFDGDGFIEIGLIDRPHLAKTLRLWRFKRGKLREVATLKGLTNHQIGWDFIASGIRDCGRGPEMITADARWQHIMATRFDGKTIATRRIGAYAGPKNITRALSCPR